MNEKSNKNVFIHECDHCLANAEIFLKASRKNLDNEIMESYLKKNSNNNNSNNNTNSINIKRINNLFKLIREELKNAECCFDRYNNQKE
jgi:hypothetical protein